ncbi:NADH-quinone oxidoreductase subunit NuoK [Terrabacter sp. BE26]|uniref:NADH-quinone oxidoreductase subunit NuoK n=1 Tax=Terrabacter sp. BE26 TaxID=2898152 RepID=UPI0035BE6FB8
MIHLSLPAALAALLAAFGVYGVLARRNAVLVLIGVELVLNAANLLLVTAGTRTAGAAFSAGPVLTLFVVTIAAAEITVALAIILVMFRRAGHIDLTAVPDLREEAVEDPTGDTEPSAPAGRAVR